VKRTPMPDGYAGCFEKGVSEMKRRYNKKITDPFI